jgi:hypothetical protein
LKYLEKIIEVKSASPKNKIFLFYISGICDNKIALLHNVSSSALN